jgi:acyl-coenzyme A synthetase/AMP-(fatty) acid ligase
LVVRARKEQPASTLVAQIAAANLKLADYKRVARYLLWEHEFPRTASMKVKRELLARELRSAARAAQLLAS